MGNSLGGMESYIRLAREYPQYQGGFVVGLHGPGPLAAGRAGPPVPWAMAATLESAPPTMRSAPTASSLQTGRRSPPMQDLRYWLRHPRAVRACLGRRRMPARLRHCTLPPLRAGGPLTVVEGDVNLGVQGEGFALQFSYTEGGLASLRKGDTEWIWRAPPPGPVARPHRERPGLRLPGGQRRPGWRPTPTPSWEGWTTAREAGRQRADHLYLPLPHGAGGLGGSLLYRHRQRPAGGCPLPWDRKRARTAVVRGALCHGTAPPPGVSWTGLSGGDLPRPV